MTSFKFFTFIFVVYINVHYTAIIVKHYEPGTFLIFTYIRTIRDSSKTSVNNVKKQPRFLLNDGVRLESTITSNRNVNHNLMAKISNNKSLLLDSSSVRIPFYF